MDLFKLPGIAETIDWTEALMQLDVLELTPHAINDTLGVLLKYQDDIARLHGSEAARLLEQVKAEAAAAGEPCRGLIRHRRPSPRAARGPGDAGPDDGDGRPTLQRGRDEGLHASPQRRQPGGRLLANLMHFARTLRAAGLPVGPGKVIDAVAAVRTVGITDRRDFYWTLHAVFVNRPDQRLIFDQAFHVFWRNPDLLKKMMGLVLPEMRIDMPRTRARRWFGGLPKRCTPTSAKRAKPRRPRPKSTRR